MSVIGYLGRLVRSEATRWYAGTVAATMLILTWVLQLWRADIRVPFDYAGDAQLYALTVKTMIEQGWYQVNSSLAAPQGLKLYDYPFVEPGHLAVMKLISLFARDYATTINVYYLLTYPLAAVATLYVFRRLNVSWLWSSVGALVFAFTPFHLWRGEGHLNLSAYYAVPLAVLLIFRIYQPLRSNGNPGEAGWRRPSRHDIVFAVIACLLVAFTGYYYAFFTMILATVAGIMVSLAGRNWRHLITSSAVVLLLALAILISLAPNVAYWAANGKGDAGVRAAHESLDHGLLPAFMILPVSGHRVPALAKLTAYWSEQAEKREMLSENPGVALGIVGVVGFVILLLVLGTSLNPSLFPRSKLLAVAAQQNIFAVLFATAGGLGVLIAGLWPQYRSYNRLSIFIVFFCVLAVIVCAESLVSNRRTSVAVIAATLIVVIAVLDQTNGSQIPDYRGIRAEYLADASFVSSLESTLPDKAMVLQLPYVTFPDAPQSQLGQYDYLRMYLHSTKLRWSYGTLKGSEQERVMMALASSDPKTEMLPAAKRLGFTALLLDTAALREDVRAAAIADIESNLGKPVMKSQDARLLLYRL